MFWKSKRQHAVDSNGNLSNKSTNSVDHYIKPKRKYLLKILIVLVVFIVGITAWLGSSIWRAVAQIVTTNVGKSAPFLHFAGNVEPDKIQGEGDGRINILLLGLGGKGHPGGELTDTIIVASLDPVNKKLSLMSIPRDLYVKIPGAGWNKINYAHSYGEQNIKTTGGGPELSKKVVSEILDLPIHYFIKMDFSGFTKLVDTLGGVEINVEKAVYDPYYPATNMIDYDPFSISAGLHKLDGKTALKFVRSRETSSDFDRSHRQQQLMVAMRDKILSTGTVTNPKKVTEIMGILGEHLKTDLQLWEIQKLFSIIKDVDTSSIITRVLDNSTDGLLMSGAVEGGYYLVPKAGIGKYEQIQKLAHEIFSDPYLQKENAKIEILNGSEKAGVALEVSELLKSYGYNIYSVDKNPELVSKTVIYDYSQGKNPFTSKFLSDRFKQQIKNQPKPQGSSVDFSIIIGQDYIK